MFSELLKLAFNNLMRARIRLMMTSGGVLIGTAAIVLLIALTIGLQRSAEEGVGKSASFTRITVTQNSGGFGGQGNSKAPALTIENIKNIQALNGVATIVPVLRVEAGGSMKADNLIGYGELIGIDPRYYPSLGLKPIKDGQNMAIAGRNLQRGFYEEDSDDFSVTTINLENRTIDLVFFVKNSSTEEQVTIVQVLKSEIFQDSLIIPFKDAVAYNKQYKAADDKPTDSDKIIYDTLIVRTRDREATLAVTDAIRDMGFKTSGAGDMLSKLNGFFNMMRLALGGIGSVALLVAAFGVANTMIMAILERTREIGLMKAIGATDSEVMGVFIIESALVGFFGGVAGIITSFVLQDILNRAIQNFAKAQKAAGGSGGASMMPINLSNMNGQLIVIPSELIVFAIVLSTFVGIAAGLYPALRAARMLTVTALKSD